MSNIGEVNQILARKFFFCIQGEYFQLYFQMCNNGVQCSWPQFICPELCKMIAGGWDQFSIMVGHTSTPWFQEVCSKSFYVWVLLVPFPPFAGVVCTSRAILNFGELSHLLDNCFQVLLFSS